MLGNPVLGRSREHTKKFPKNLPEKFAGAARLSGWDRAGKKDEGGGVAYLQQRLRLSGTGDAGAEAAGKAGEQQPWAGGGCGPVAGESAGMVTAAPAPRDTRDPAATPVQEARASGEEGKTRPAHASDACTPALLPARACSPTRPACNRQAGVGRGRCLQHVRAPESTAL